MEWDNKDIYHMVLYINAELKKGRTQKDIENNDFGVKERVIAKKLNRRGYKKINNEWVCINEKSFSKNGENVSNKREYDNNNTLIIHDRKVLENLMSLSNNYDKIIKIINEYDNKCDNKSYSKYDNEYDGIEIKLPVETIKDFRTSIRINNVVWEQFDLFAEKHKEFTKRDLLSMALIEYIKNHSNE